MLSKSEDFESVIDNLQDHGHSLAALASRVTRIEQLVHDLFGAFDEQQAVSADVVKGLGICFKKLKSHGKRQEAALGKSQAAGSSGAAPVAVTPEDIFAALGGKGLSPVGRYNLEKSVEHLFLSGNAKNVAYNPEKAWLLQRDRRIGRWQVDVWQRTGLIDAGIDV